MQILNQVIADKLKEILDLKSEIELLETKCNSLLRDEPFEKLNELQLKITCLKEELNTKEGQALTFFN